MDLKWVNQMESAVKSISFVLMEKTRNQWHNNGGRDYMIKLALAEPGSGDHIKHMPLGKVGDVVREIIECENYVGLLG